VPHFGVRTWLLTALMGAVAVLRLSGWSPHEHCMCGGCCSPDGFNETGAIATLRNLIMAERQFRDARACDENGDGKGEFGGFAELSGATGVRGGAPAPPVLTRTFASLRDGTVVRVGYHLRIWLPRRGRGFVAERDGGGFAPGTVDPARAATMWWAYAWPVREERWQQRTFFVSSEGDILATTGYAADHEPLPDAALDAKGKVAVNATGRDGRIWRQTG